MKVEKKSAKTCIVTTRVLEKRTIMAMRITLAIMKAKMVKNTHSHFPFVFQSFERASH
jgi:hypothetical protein